MKKLLLALSIVSLSFFGICFAGSKKKNVKTSTQKQLADQIVFVNFDAFEGSIRIHGKRYSRSLEFNDIQSHIDETHKQLHEVGLSTEKVNELCNAVNKLCNIQSKIRDKFRILAKIIAKNLCARALLGLSFNDLVFDPAYDITDRVIEQLNKEYLESIKTCPTCNQSINNN